MLDTKAQPRETSNSLNCSDSRRKTGDNNAYHGKSIGRALHEVNEEAIELVAMRLQIARAKMAEKLS